MNHQPFLLDDTDIQLLPERIERTYTIAGCIKLMEGLLLSSKYEEPEWFDSCEFDWWWEMMTGNMLSDDVREAIKLKYANIE